MSPQPEECEALREFSFGLVCEQGESQLLDILREHEEAEIRSSCANWQDGLFWRVDHAQGPQHQLGALDNVFLNKETCNDCLADVAHTESLDYRLLDSQSRQRAYYTYRRDTSDQQSIPKMAAQYFGAGTVVHSVYHGNRADWRILMRSDEKVGLFYDALQVILPSEIRFDLGHLRDAQGWEGTRRLSATLPAEQQRVLEVAHNLGYYETPREASHEEIAEVLDVPRTTVSYRLQRAESQLASAYLSNTDL